MTLDVIEQQEQTMTSPSNMPTFFFSNGDLPLYQGRWSPGTEAVVGFCCEHVETRCDNAKNGRRQRPAQAGAVPVALLLHPPCVAHKTRNCP